MSGVNGQAPWQTDREELLAKQAEIYLHQRDAALECMNRLVDMLDELGGYRTREQQDVRLDALFLLETNGVRPQSRRWRP